MVQILEDRRLDARVLPRHGQRGRISIVLVAAVVAAVVVAAVVAVAVAAVVVAVPYASCPETRTLYP